MINGRAGCRNEAANHKLVGILAPLEPHSLNVGDEEYDAVHNQCLPAKGWPGTDTATVGAPSE